MAKGIALALSAGFGLVALRASTAQAAECPPGSPFFCEDADPPARVGREPEVDEDGGAPARACEVEPTRLVVVQVELSCTGGEDRLAEESAPEEELEEGEPEEEGDPEEEFPSQALRSFGIGVFGQGLLATGPRAENGRTVGGFGLHLRWRPEPSLSFDAGVIGMGGSEHRGRTRAEVAGFLDLLWLPTEGALRPYILVGGELAWARSSSPAADERSTDYEYMAPRGGLGLELAPGDLVTVFLDGIFAPRFPMNEAAEAELADSDWRATVALRSGIVAWW